MSINNWTIRPRPIDDAFKAALAAALAEKNIADRIEAIHALGFGDLGLALGLADFLDQMADPES